MPKSTTKTARAAALVVAACIAGGFQHQAQAAVVCEDTDAYYKEIYGNFTSKTGIELRDILRGRLEDPYNSIPYSDSSEFDARDALEIIDKTSEGFVTELYTRDNSPISSSDWNREHVWPSSRGLKPDTSIPYSDIHNLRAADMNVNSARGNLVFGDCPNCGVGHQEAPETKKNGTVFEPPDVVKGDVARIVFYMYTRHTGLLLSDDPEPGSTMGRLDDLIRWHEQDPVSQEEIDRNLGACKIQLNRNPFVDFPCLVDQMLGSKSVACSTSPPVILPTSSPTRTRPPSGTPSAAPTDVPSAAPTLAPTAPTAQVTEAPTTPTNQATAVLISQYLEGSSENKVLQVRNVGSSSADLDTINLRLFYNGNTASLAFTFPAGTTLGAGKTFTICNPSLAATALSICDMTFGGLTFNGDDVIALTAASDASVVYDVIGTVGVKAVAQACNVPATKNKNMVRAASVTVGNGGVWAGNNGCDQWTVQSTDMWADYQCMLGSDLASCTRPLAGPWPIAKPTISPSASPTTSPTIARVDGTPSAAPTTVSPTLSPTITSGNGTSTASPSVRPTSSASASPTPANESSSGASLVDIAVIIAGVATALLLVGVAYCYCTSGARRARQQGTFPTAMTLSKTPGGLQDNGMRSAYNPKYGASGREGWPDV
jgi:endonuclease I